MNRKHRICVITYPFARAFAVPLSNLEEILSSFSDYLYVIVGGEKNAITKTNRRIQTYRLDHQPGTNILTRIARYVYVQIRISLVLTGISKDIDICILFMEPGTLLPIIMAKLLKKKVILALPSSIRMRRNHKESFLALLVYLKTINYILSDWIILYSTNLIEEWKLEKYRTKVLIAHEHFLDFNKLKIIKQFNKRDILIGYVGRLSEEKGILNFIKAIPGLMEKRKELSFLIAGEGELRGELENFSREKNLNCINFTGWIPHDELPNYLNELKLIVLPSYTEGLPNIMLEAMACGTPVLATPVGVIPDVIKDCETGFIMENNSPECIAKNVTRALEYPCIEGIVKNASTLVKEKYSYDKSVERYRTIIKGV